MGRVVKLFDERGALLSLCEETVSVIHLTNKVSAIKRLTDMHGILSLSLEILDLYPEAFYWHLPALNDLDRINRELLIYDRADFTPVRRFDDYSISVTRLVQGAKRKAEMGITALLK